METNNFDLKFYLATLRTARAIGLEMVEEDLLIQVLAIVYFEDGNEQLTHSYKLLGDVEFAQEVFHVHGGVIPDSRFVQKLNVHIKEIREYKRAHQGEGYPEWARKLIKSRYGIELRG